MINVVCDTCGTQEEQDKLSANWKSYTGSDGKDKHFCCLQCFQKFVSELKE